MHAWPCNRGTNSFTQSKLWNHAALEFLAYVSSLPISACPHLEHQLDWDHKGVDRDLNEIALHMLGWEEKLCAHLGLTAVDIYDIKAIHASNPALQR